MTRTATEHKVLTVDKGRACVHLARVRAAPNLTTNHHYAHYFEHTHLRNDNGDTNGKFANWHP